MAKSLILIDGMAMAYRGYFAMINNPLINSKGENTSSLYVFTNFVIKIKEWLKPDYAVCVFDTHAPTFRHALYGAYKATRKPTPSGLRASLPMIKEMLRVVGVHSIEMDGYEADDIIGTLARLGEGRDCEVGIFTGDKDFYQLVTDKTCLRDMKTFEKITGEQVKVKMGVTPDKIIDLLAIIGDKVDNVPGISGIGPVTAIKLLNEFGSLINIFYHVNVISQKKTARILAGSREIAELSQKLVTIDRNVPLIWDESTFSIRDIDIETMSRFCARYELNTVYNKYLESLRSQQDKEF